MIAVSAFPWARRSNDMLNGLGTSGFRAGLGFFNRTVILYHGTFTVNSLAHIFGKRRFETDDNSRNNWFVALLTLGEGWHNNHHHYAASERQSLYWWEIDVSHYTLTVLSWFGIVWDLHAPPTDVASVRKVSSGTNALDRTGSTAAFLSE